MLPHTATPPSTPFFAPGRGARVQAFSGSFENAEYLVNDLPHMRLDSSRERASFVAGLNTVCRRLGLRDGTVHCRGAEPVDCARHLLAAIGRILRLERFRSLGHAPVLPPAVTVLGVLVPR